LFDRIDQGFCTIEVAFDEHDKPVDHRFLEVSPSFERQTGIKNAAGGWMREIAPGQDQHWFDTYGPCTHRRAGALRKPFDTTRPLVGRLCLSHQRTSPNCRAFLRRHQAEARADEALQQSEPAPRELNDTLAMHVLQNFMDECALLRPDTRLG